VRNNRWRTILVWIRDPFAEEQPAVAKAAAVARRCGAKLILLNTFMIPQPVNDVPMGDHKLIVASATAHRKKKLLQLSKKLRLPGRIRCEVHWDYPEAEAILRQVQAEHPDVVMMASQRHGHIARWLLRNSDWELIRACPCPVWFVRHPELRRSPLILASIDPMHRRAKPARLDSELLRVATVAADQLNGSAAVVHACEALEDGLRTQMSDEMSRARLATITLACDHGVAAEDCIVTAGEPSAVIARITRRERPDVLVMGALSRSEIGREVVGRTAERTLDEVDCDVLIVKSRPEASRAKRPPSRRTGVAAASASQHSARA